MGRKMTYKEFYSDYRSEILEKITKNKASMYLSNGRFFYNRNLKPPNRKTTMRRD